MVDTEIGHLCEEARTRSLFEGDPVFGDLVVSMTEHMDTDRIQRVVEEFFRYAMLSHRWQGREPLCSDVGDQSVYSLSTEEMPTAIKLQTFWKTAGKAGYRWAWSDTCCIDQKNQREFEKSINSMFRLQLFSHPCLPLGRTPFVATWRTDMERVAYARLDATRAPGTCRHSILQCRLDAVSLWPACQSQIIQRDHGGDSKRSWRTCRRPALLSS